jgi:hypothetical protein
MFLQSHVSSGGTQSLSRWLSPVVKRPGSWVGYSPQLAEWLERYQHASSVPAWLVAGQGPNLPLFYPVRNCYLSAGVENWSLLERKKNCYSHFYIRDLDVKMSLTRETVDLYAVVTDSSLCSSRLSSCMTSLYISASGRMLPSNRSQHICFKCIYTHPRVEAG